MTMEASALLYVVLALCMFHPIVKSYADYQALVDFIAITKKLYHPPLWRRRAAMVSMLAIATTAGLWAITVLSWWIPSAGVMLALVGAAQFSVSFRTKLNALRGLDHSYASESNKYDRWFIKRYGYAWAGVVMERFEVVTCFVGSLLWLTFGILALR
jgi:hypothetical protein